MHYCSEFSRTNLTTFCQAQSDLILPTPLPLGSLPSLTQEISGFFIVESHVLETTTSFRSSRDVEELWEALVTRLTSAIENALRTETDPDTFLKVKESLLSFILTLEVCESGFDFLMQSNQGPQAYSYSTTTLQSFILVLFEKYAKLLESQFTGRFEAVSYTARFTLDVLNSSVIDCPRG